MADLLAQCWDLDEAPAVLVGAEEVGEEDRRKRAREEEGGEQQAKRGRLKERGETTMAEQEQPAEDLELPAPERGIQAPVIEVTPATTELPKRRTSPVHLEMDLVVADEVAVEQTVPGEEDVRHDVAVENAVEPPVEDVLPLDQVEPQLFLQPAVPAKKTRKGKKAGRLVVDTALQRRSQDIKASLAEGSRTLRCEHPAQELVVREKLRCLALETAGSGLGEEMKVVVRELFRLGRAARPRLGDWEQQEQQQMGQEQQAGQEYPEVRQEEHQAQEVVTGAGEELQIEGEREASMNKVRDVSGARDATRDSLGTSGTGRPELIVAEEGAQEPREGVHASEPVEGGQDFEVNEGAQELVPPEQNADQLDLTPGMVEGSAVERAVHADDIYHGQVRSKLVCKVSKWSDFGA